ncbi:MAG: dTDP-4-dehydrorhamnose reductase [Bacteroidales bacterium]|nr:dTDP-4-dehydrorhamnose reductase [Bacteroidales bacterium]
MNVLVTGCNGQLGRALQHLAASLPQYHCIFTDIDTLDITDPAAVEQCFTEHHIETCINCAAYTAVDKAEDEPELAARINTYAPSILAATCLRHNALLVHLSTDYVFDGSASEPYPVDAPVHPMSVYGRTKADGEQRIRESGCNYLIVRTAWLYSATGKNFLKTMLALGDTRPEINVVNDQRGCPTWAPDLAQAIVSLVDIYGTKPVHETFHFTNEGQITWYDFAQTIMELAGKPCHVNPITSDQYPTKAKRPAYSVLDLGKIKQVTGLDIPFWKDSLEKCIKEL